MAQPVKFLPYKHEFRSLASTYRILAAAVCSYNPSAKEVEIGMFPEISGQPV